MTLDTDILMGTFEIGQLLGVQPMTVHMWRRRDYLNFPEPALTLKIGPIWRESDIRAWAKEYGRL